MLLQSWLVSFDQRWVFNLFSMDRVWIHTCSCCLFFGLINMYLYLTDMYQVHEHQHDVRQWLYVRIIMLFTCAFLAVMIHRSKECKIQKKQLSSYKEHPEILLRLQEYLTKKVLYTNLGMVVFSFGVLDQMWNLYGMYLIWRVEDSRFGQSITQLRGNVNISMIMLIPFVLQFVGFFYIKLSVMALSWAHPKSYIKYKKWSH